MSKELNKAPVEQAGGDELEKFLAWACKEYGIEDKYDLNENHHSIRENKKGWMARAALAQPSPAQTQPSPAPTLRAAIDVANDRFEVPVAKWGTDLVGEEERPEVAEVAFVLRNIGAMDAEDIDGDNVDLRFEDAEGRDTGCDVSIVEYAEKAADLFEQHDRIVGELRAVIAQLRQHKNDYMDSGQETYRALQNEIREREAEIARLDGLVSGHTAERDAALARVAELERKLRNEENAHTTTIEQRDNAEHWADQLANAIAERFGVDIGEHSNLNCPWNEALVWMQQPPAQAQHSVPEVSGIGRDFAYPRSVVLYLRTEPTDDDLRAIHDGLLSLAAAPGKEGL
ncbi:hypothetical protein [Pseudomonas aeruginosa]|uniref:hypothetical protein n=2 Tax=Pseudomonas aeruginosa TaxID=287 RepID=UPI0021F204C1|nr:hypothetical protein [Pseudomonas aeruginosa]MCV6451573.1 hypothetical protein [Pseudomonas aeruginosa]HCE8379572.1 hypothetical protein [Pseudomonas aeruginosa]